MRRSIALVALGLFAAGAASAQTSGTVTGRVVSTTAGRAVPQVAVQVEGTTIQTLTDTAGRFVLSAVPLGQHILLARIVGFAPARVPVRVTPDAPVTVTIQLAASALQMNDIIVTADPTGRSGKELGSGSVVGREAIANQGATSLQGVLELTPGVPLTPPGLDNTQQVSLRTLSFANSTSSTDPGSFGTLIIVDGVPMSNNANLQTTGPRGEQRPPTSAGGGIDLRRIPASNIERVEVIRGLPGVRYGDLTQGAIVVDTRAGALGPEETARYDAQTTGVTGALGRPLPVGDAGTATLDVTRTLKAPGLKADDVYRVSSQLAHRWTVQGAGDTPRISLDSRLGLTLLDDNNPENPDVAPGFSSLGKEWDLVSGERLGINLGEHSSLTVTTAFTRGWQTTASASPEFRATIPFTDRLTEGTQVGRFIAGQYEANVQLDGQPTLLYTRAEWEHRLGGGRLRQTWVAGTELRREWNNGAGYQFDIAFPPQTTFNAVNGFDRPRPFSAIPPLATSAAYAEDRLTMALPFRTTLDVQAGARLDVMHRGTWWTSGVRSSVFQPRLSASWALTPWLRLRGGAGRTAKTPSLGQLYPAPQYYDLVNVSWFANDPAERLAVLTTFIRDPTNPDLGYSVGIKREAGVEVDLGRGTTLGVTLFKDATDGAVGFTHETGYLVRDLYDLTDSTAGTGVPPDIIVPATRHDTVPIVTDRPANNLHLDNHGVEVTASFAEFKPLHLTMDVEAAWISAEQDETGITFGPSGGFSNFQLDQSQARYPYWAAPTQTRTRGVAVYRLVHHQPNVGLVITATVEHLFKEQFQTVAGTDTLAFLGYITRAGQLVPVAAADRGDPQYNDLHRSLSGTLTAPLPTPADWFMSIQVAKTLPYGGRLTFYAFNALDRRGSPQSGQTTARVLLPARFGVEMTFSPAGR